MNERDWQRLERRLIDAHIGADPPLSRTVWRGVETALMPQPARRGVRLAMGIVVVAAAAAVALWFLPTERPVSTAARTPATQSPAMVESLRAGPTRSEKAAAASLNQVLETTRAVTFAIAADAGRIEVEPCKGRFVNVTVLDSPHRALQLVVSGRRVEARFDDGAVMAAGVAHVLVPADTHLIISTRTGPVVVRGLGGPMEIDTRSGEVRVDTSPRIDPTVAITSDRGAVAWQGRCGRGCRVDARSRIGDITLRAPDPSVFTRGAVRGESQAGRVDLEELTCTDPRCSSSPLPWRQLAPGKDH